MPSTIATGGPARLSTSDQDGLAPSAMRHLAGDQTALTALTSRGAQLLARLPA